MKKLLLTLVVSLAFCGSIFAQDLNINPMGYESHWSDVFYGGDYEDQDGVTAFIIIDDNRVTVEDDWYNYEVGFFVMSNGAEVCRGHDFLCEPEMGFIDYPYLNASAVYYTNPGELVYFKLYNHETGIEYGFGTSNIECHTGEGHWEYYDYWDYDLSLNLSFVTPEQEGYTLDITPYSGEKDHYYLIASPIGGVTASNVANLTSNSYDLYEFDQVGDGEGNEWINHRGEAEFELQPGVGYLYANSGDGEQELVQLTFTGTPIEGELMDLDLTFDESAEDFPGWNLVGNPFEVTAYLSQPFYTLNVEGAYISHDADAELPAMTGAFVTASAEVGSVTFTKEAPAKTSKLALNLSNNSGLIDRAIIRFGQGQQLPKLQFRNTSTKVYIPLDNIDYAVVASEGMGEMPVNFKAETNGAYTLTVAPEEVSFNYLHLIDNLTGADVDMLANPTYSFDAQTTDYASRFRLVFATGNAEDNFAFFSNGNFIVSNDGEATVQVVDVNGRILSSLNINGSASINVDGAAGVYMIRLINGDNVKVQKIIVK